MKIRGNNINEVWRKALCNLMDFGVESAPRGKKTKELLNVTLEIQNPRYRYLLDPIRNIRLPFALAEFMWIISGRDDVEMISYYNKNMANFSDDGKILHGAYGKRLVYWYDNKDQITKVINKLSLDKDSRQAVMIIFDPAKDYIQTKDVPCTIMFQFLIRDNKLNMITYMRSNDIWLGTPYDIHQFTMLQEYIAATLNVDLGIYYHNIGSFHIYEDNFEKAKEILNSDIKDFNNYEYPKINKDDVLFLKKLFSIEHFIGCCPNNNNEINDVIIKEIKEFINQSRFFGNIAIVLFIHKLIKDNNYEYANKFIDEFPDSHVYKEFLLRMKR